MKNIDFHSEFQKEEKKAEINESGKLLAEFLLSYFNMIDEMNSKVLNLHKEFIVQTGKIISEYIQKSDAKKSDLINEILKSAKNTGDVKTPLPLQ
jgi:ribosomal protein S18